MTMEIRRLVLAGVAVALAAVPAGAATIRGRVVDQQKGVALPGATVKVSGTPLGATTARDGRFSIADAPDGPQTLTVDYVGYPRATRQVAGDGADLEIGLAGTDPTEIVVTGNRLAERRALQTKRAADNLVEALYANDVGKLPDQNVAEAVRRLPGLSVANDQGEGRYVIIRGVNPNLVNVTLNGLTLPAPEPDGRQVKLDDIPSALISAVVVTKSLTPDQDANAIGGEVNIRTLSAFDRNKRFFLDARGAYGWYALNHRQPWEADGQAGSVFGADGQFGAVLSVNYSRRPIESENFQGATSFPNGRPDQFGLRDYNLVRTRLGVVANLDWHPGDTVKLYLRTSYSRFTDSETRDQERVDNLAFPAAAPGTYTGRGSLLVRRRTEKDNTKSAQLGGNFDLGDAGKLDLTGGYTRAIKNDPLRSEFNFRTSGSTAIAGAYDLTRNPYAFTFNAPFNPANFPLNSVNYDRRHAQEDLWQIRGDYALPIGIGSGSAVKLGAKYLDRHKTNDRNYLQYSRGTTFNASSASFQGDADFYDGAFTFGPRIDYDAAQAYAVANPSAIVQSASNINSSRNNSQINDYDVRERIAAGYAMATLRFGALTLVPGVRVEHTRARAQAKLIATGTAAVDQPFNSFTGNGYTDWFPGLNAHYDLARNLVLRGAVTTALGRPNYPDLAPYVSVDTTASPTAVTLGNPDLKRYKATNLDASVEYYLPGQGILSAGLFYKHLDDPIYTQGRVGVSGTFGGQALANVNVIQAVNAREAVVRGVEVNAQVQFTFLPAPFDGFGIGANYAHITGHASGLPGRAGHVPLFLQSKHVGTAQLFYEKYGVALRVAYSLRSAYVDTIGTAAATDQYTGYNGQLDVNASYQVTPSLTVFAQGTNLNDAPWRRYLGARRFLIERERYDLALRGGVQLHF